MPGPPRPLPARTAEKAGSSRHAPRYTGSVRGDSLRDLYAKALALFGLAVLAAAGALFDYWPITNEIPAVARLRLQPAGAPSVPLPLPSELPPVVALTAERAVRPIRSLPAPPLPPAVVEEPKPFTGGIVASIAPVRMTFGTPASLASIDMPSADAPPLTVTRAVAPPDEVVLEVMPLMAPAPGPDDGSAVGFVTGALKKTGQTIAKTGARTGASIRDALVSFGGAFRKIL